MKKNPLIWIAIILIIIPIFCTGVYQLPAINEAISWRLMNLRTQIHYYFNPPDQVILSPVDVTIPERPNGLPTLFPTLTPPAPLATPATSVATSTTPVPTRVPMDLPSRWMIEGVPHEYQSFNNCGPANLSMILRYWGWDGDQRDVRDVLRPNENDSNVMPDEMVFFVNHSSELQALMRQGGSLTLIKQFLAEGFPVLIESGHQPEDDWWMGHYVTITGYDDALSLFMTQDSLIMPDFPLAYEDLEDNGWRDFNRLYIIIYPPDQESTVFSLLDQDLDPVQNVNNSLQATLNETHTVGQRAYFFALFNQGADLVSLERYAEAADVFDQAFAFYQTLNEDDRPWRVLWYRVEPYKAYYYTGRFQAVIDLASATLSMLNKCGLEESHYWRGMAYEAIGNKEKALFDYQIALEVHPGYQPALDSIQRLQP